MYCFWGWESDPTFHFNADPDPDPASHKSYANLRPVQGDFAEPPRFHCPRTFHFEQLKPLKFDFNADPDPGFHSITDPDPDFSLQCGSESSFLK
jgi:hypothetical protein